MTRNAACPAGQAAFLTLGRRGGLLTVKDEVVHVHRLRRLLLHVSRSFGKRGSSQYMRRRARNVPKTGEKFPRSGG